MRTLVATILALVVAGCSTGLPTAAPAPSPLPSPPATVPVAATLATMPLPATMPPPATSAPSIARAGLLGMPAPALQGAAEAQGLVFESLPGAGVPMTLGRVPGGTGELLLVGDPVSVIGWKVAAPFIDNGHLHGFLAAMGRKDVIAWMDGQVGMLMSGTGGQATSEVAGMPLLLIARDPGIETEMMALVIGDPARLAGGIAIPEVAASPSPQPDDLAAPLRSYAEQAAAVNGALARNLEIVLDRGARLATRRQAAGRALDAEQAFSAALRGLALPPGLADQALAVAEVSDRVQGILSACAAAPDAGALDAALPRLVDALEVASAHAQALRASLLAQPVGVLELGSDPLPPPVVMAGTLEEPGTLEVAGHAMSMDSGKGDLAVYLLNPTAAFALAVTVEARLYAYDGSLLATETLAADVVLPSSQAILSMPITTTPGAAAPQRVEVGAVTVDRWRAAASPMIRGR